MAMEPQGRKLIFRGTGRHDVSEVTLSNGEHEVERGDLNARITYTFSYKDNVLMHTSPEQEQEIAEELNESIKAKLAEILNK